MGLFYPGFYSCPAEFAVAYWSFAPLSDEATLVSQQPTGIGNTTGPRDMWTQKAEAGLEYWGYWSGVAEFYPSTTVSFVSFKPGVYTLAAGDAWGHLAILYFEVIPAASTLTCAGVSSNSSYVAYTNASVNSGPLGLSAYYKVPGSNDTYLLAMYGTGSSSVTLTYFQFATSWPLQFSPDPTQIQSWQYFTPNGTLAYPATFSPNQCSLVRVVLPYPSTNIVLALEFSNNQSQTFTLRT